MIKKHSLLFLFIHLSIFSFCQAKIESGQGNQDQMIENAVMSSDQNEFNEDAFLEEIEYCKKHPVEVNTAEIKKLEELGLLSALQLENLNSYKKLLGPLSCIYELQSISDWDVSIINKIRPYVTVNIKNNAEDFIRENFTQTKNNILLRLTQALPFSDGYHLNGISNTKAFEGSSQGVSFKYNFTSQKNISIGITGDKDPGESFYRRNKFKGFDFYSAFLAYKRKGLLRSLVLGDFVINMGQGLIQWQSLGFKKGADVLSIKRQAATLKPYHSFGENNFHRGIGFTLAFKNYELTLFGSYKKNDANLNYDTLINEEQFISSIISAGLHRTQSEIESKGALKELLFGGRLVFNSNNGSIGLNSVHYFFNLPLIKNNQPYNLYTFNGKQLSCFSADYSFTKNNAHFFGEIAFSGNQGLACVNGALISVSRNIDLSFLQRNISKKYISLYANSFTENTSPTNENGFYAGVSLRPNDLWQVNAYVDLYKFPWLKYQQNNLMSGCDYLVQGTYKFNKKTSLNIRIRSYKEGESHYLNLPSLIEHTQNIKNSVRFQVDFNVSNSLTVKNRLELVRCNESGGGASDGFLTYIAFYYKPQLKSYTGNLMVFLFDTYDYSSRIYAHESDLLYSFSIPAFYGKGVKFSANFSCKIGKKTSVWLKWSGLYSIDHQNFGSGNDEIQGGFKEEIKTQLLFQF